MLKFSGYPCLTWDPVLPKPLLSNSHTERRRDPCVVLFTYYYIQEYKTHTHTQREREIERERHKDPQRERRERETEKTHNHHHHHKTESFHIGEESGAFSFSLSFFLSLDRNLVFVYTPREVGFPFKSQGWTVSLKVATKHTTTCMHACMHAYTHTHTHTHTHTL